MRSIPGCAPLFGVVVVSGIPGRLHVVVGHGLHGRVCHHIVTTLSPHCHHIVTTLSPLRPHLLSPPQALKLCQGGLMLSLDTAFTAFLQGGPVIDMIAKVCVCVWCQ